MFMLYQQHCLSKIWQKQINNQSQFLSLRLACCGQGQSALLRCIKSPLSNCAPFSLVTRCGPKKRSGRFKRIHAEANVPPSPGPDNTDPHDLRSRTKAPAVKLGWPLLLSVALACFIFRHCTASSRPQHQLTPCQAAVAMVSETSHSSTPLQRPAAFSGQGQQQAFASISAAGFAKLFKGAQKAHLAQMLVYQAQRVSFPPSLIYPLGCKPPFTPPLPQRLNPIPTNVLNLAGPFPQPP